MRRGFTLVELAIVMTIIGILIGGVLKGQEMLNNARITATIASVKSIETASLAFFDRFDQFPGDMRNATQKLPNCDPGLCFDGNGNNVLGRVPANPTINMEISQGGINTLPEVETTMYWQHMLLADLLSGTEPADPLVPAWGRTHPASPIGGGFVAVFVRGLGTAATGVGFQASRSGTALVMKTAINGEDNTNDPHLLSPKNAAAMDRKFDDGLPNTGIMFGEHVNSGCKTSDNPDGVYNMQDTDQACIITILLGGM